MTDFYNPYHFVPVKDAPRIDDLDRKTFDKRLFGYMTHDRFVPDTLSGRMICRFTTDGLLFIGHERTIEATEKNPTEVSPFEIEGKPAIPASSLRGLISSLAEAASNSAMRVLEDREYSYRMGMKDNIRPLSALGMIIEFKDSGKTIRKLRPLALPSLKCSYNKKQNRADTEIPPEFRQMFTKPLLKVYINGYEHNKNITPSRLERSHNTFLGDNDPLSFSADHPEFWYLKLNNQSQLNNNKLTCLNPLIKEILSGNQFVYYLNGQTSTEEPISKQDYDKLDNTEKEKFVQGILRVLGIKGRETVIPEGKKHEMFIPYREEIEGQLPAFNAEAAIEQFERLAAERTNIDKELPFHVKESKRNDDPQKYKNYIRLRHGDIVFFRPDPDDPSKVAEVSISSIWRRRAGGSSHDYFRAVSPELLPFNKDRTVITIAEQLFGFVDQNKNSDAEHTKALKSRLRFSHACFDRWTDGIDKSFYLDPATLKILDKPKPPCPTLYFKHKDGSGGYIKKQQLKPGDHLPQGRKMYLHQDSKNEPWKTNPQPPSPCRESDRCKQKVRITPIREGAIFYFHIDFENLSENELGLLCYSISPSDKFYHKIGMGKPIGLGTVKIEPVGIFLIDRQSRYREQDIFNAKRYHAGWLLQNDELEKLPGIYDRERKEYGKIENKPNNYFDNLRNDFKKKIDEDISKAIEIIGETLKKNIPIHYPQLENRDIEKEIFKWFVANDKKTSGNQYLEPLNKNSNSLPPPLKR
jgi:CRISPR-associated protein (TIGR03986 family)